MATDLAVLLQPKSAPAILTELITELASRLDGAGQPLFPVTDYNIGGVARTLLESEAVTLADLYQMIVVVAKSGLLEFADGEYLDLIGTNHYALTRKPSVFTRKRLRLTAQAGFGPYTLSAGDVIASTTGSPALVFQSISAGTIAQGGTLDIVIQAERASAAYNVPDNTITLLQTPLPGVTCTNLVDLISDVAGAEQETDALYKQRCRLRWSELGGGATKNAYIFWALTAVAGVILVNVLDQHPRGQGTVDVIVYGNGALGAAQITAVNDYIQKRKPITADVLVYGAIQTTQAITATIFVESAYRQIAEAQALANLTALQKDIGIGGVIFRAAIIEALMQPTGVINTTVATPLADVVLASNNVVVFTLNLTWTEV